MSDKRSNDGVGEIGLKDLKGRTIRGGFVTLAAQIAKFIIRTGSIMLLARLLAPEEFGLVGMVAAVIGIFGLFKDAGLTMVTVQRSTITNDQISNLYWLNIAICTILMLLSWMIAPVLVSFYKEPKLFWMTVAMSTVFFIHALSAQHQALLQRNMRYATIALIEVFSMLAGFIVGVVMAFGGFSYWSLVAIAIIEPALNTVCVLCVSGWIPGKPKRGTEITSMMQFGGALTLNGLIIYLAFNAEKILLGRFWGAEALGLYGRAYQLMKMPTDQLNSAIGWVSFTAISRLQDDPARFKNYFLKGYSLFLAPTVPLTILCAIFADEMVLVLLGPNWKNAALIFRFLAPAVLAFPLINPLKWMLISRGLAWRNLKMSLFIAVLVIVGYLVGLRYGPAGVALGFSIMMTLLVVPMIAYAIHETPISSHDIVRTIKPLFLAGIVAATVTLGARFLFGYLLAPFPWLVLGALILLGSYLWMLLYVMGQKEMYWDLIREIRKRSSFDEKESGNEAFVDAS